jgi:fructoselysine-6-P-deglycase FrlB-like protein
MRGRLLEEEGTVKLGGLTGMDDELREIKRVIILGCGTSWHSGLIGEYLLEDIARIPTEVEYASEFRYRRPVVEPGTLAIAISQSGETADTLWAMREAKQQGATLLGIVNAGGLHHRARDRRRGLPARRPGDRRGLDQGVHLAGGGADDAHRAPRRLRGTLNAARGREIVRALGRIPEQVAEILEMEPAIRQLAEEYKDHPNFLYLGRGYNFPAALEGALKLKEISYIHAEGYPAAEMKHGPIALIDESMPVVVIAPRDGVYEKIKSNIEEVKARGGNVIAVITEGDTELLQYANHVIQIPRTHDALTPILASVPLQLLAYHIAVLRGCERGPAAEPGEVASRSSRSAGVARVHEHGEVRLGFQDGDRSHVERVACCGLEGSDSALAEDHLAVPLAHDVLGRHQKLGDGRGEATLQEHGALHPPHLGQECEVLHVAGTDLENVRVLGDQLHLARVHHLGHHREPRLGSNLGEQTQRLEAEPLEGIRGGARLEGTAADEAPTRTAYPTRGLVQHLSILHRARPGDHRKCLAADQRAAASCQSYHAPLRREFSRCQLVRLADRGDRLHPGKVEERDLAEELRVTNAPDDAAGGPAREMRAHTERLHPLANPVQLTIGDLRTCRDDHRLLLVL